MGLPIIRVSVHDGHGASATVTPFLLIIVINAACLAFSNMMTAQQSDITNLVFAVIFTVEVLLKNAAWGAKAYFRHPDHIFDFCVAVAAATDSMSYFLHTHCRSNESTILRLIRSLRSFRIMRIIFVVPGAKIVVLACAFCARSLANVCFLIVICLLVFST